MFNLVLSLLLGALTHSILSTILFRDRILTDLRAHANQSCESADVKEGYTTFPYHQLFTQHVKTINCAYDDRLAMGCFLLISTIMFACCYVASATMLKHLLLRLVHAEERPVQV